MGIVEIATNSFDYCVHASVVLKHYAADKNQASPARYHISVHNFNLDILLTYGSVVGTYIRIWSERAFPH